MTQQLKLNLKKKNKKGGSEGKRLGKYGNQMSVP